ncbi:MAG: hypothetical protein ACI898_000448, partial [Flavobacteriales bacterium]
MISENHSYTLANSIRGSSLFTRSWNKAKNQLYLQGRNVWK